MSWQRLAGWRASSATQVCFLIGALVIKIGYTSFFICLGLLDVVGAVILWTVVKMEVPVEV